jgi:hypothetical protein
LPKQGDDNAKCKALRSMPESGGGCEVIAVCSSRSGAPHYGPATRQSNAISRYRHCDVRSVRREQKLHNEPGSNTSKYRGMKELFRIHPSPARRSNQSQLIALACFTKSKTLGTDSRGLSGLQQVAV